MRSDAIVETWELAKRFRGGPVDDQRFWAQALYEEARKLLHPPPTRTVVDGISPSIRRGEFFGIIGSNGAGKTTPLKVERQVFLPPERRVHDDDHALRPECFERVAQLDEHVRVRRGSSRSRPAP